MIHYLNYIHFQILSDKVTILGIRSRHNVRVKSTNNCPLIWIFVQSGDMLCKGSCSQALTPSVNQGTGAVWGQNTRLSMSSKNKQDRKKREPRRTVTNRERMKKRAKKRERERDERERDQEKEINR